MKKIFEEKGITVLNPIANLWSIVKRRLVWKDCAPQPKQTQLKLLLAYGSLIKGLLKSANNM